ncbi:MAG TPA: Ig-like domain-containing protein [Actinocrinis sp.]|nr:Ig-like domain-containing protein [Actinocrinis sp.]
MRWTVPAALGTAVVALAGAAWLGLSGDGGPASSGRAEAAPLPPAEPATLSIADGAVGVAPDAPLVVTAPQGERLGSVLVAAPGAAVAGVFSADRRTWTGTGHLKFATSYTVTAVTTAAAKATPAKKHATFQTADPTGSPIDFQQIAPDDGSVDGVAQPVVLDFAAPVTDRAAVENSLKVTSVPAQPGHWSWVSDSRVDYRPEAFWQPGTKVTVQMALNGLSAGNGEYGTADKTLSFTVGRDQETVANVATHQAVVYRDGKVFGTFPFSGGMPGLDTWGGTFAVMDKVTDLRMDSETAGLGDAYDIPDVKWDVHLTDSGTYVHAAPWSVGDQGVDNVSHGCIGTSDEKAEWFYDNTIPGDVVKVINSPRTGAPGNGYNDFTASWSQWLAGSAVPGAE